ncbi:NAD(P)/FAD-dependent oxidoreductase [Saccharopolyspora pogona]|uniref:hypothetical protein n=1 Tax=Saccharopolyspora pogona TaxID=333966 RepID=UPI001CC23436|nr:hypothetical protein [Saccharopolyspora pogona]
MQRLFCNAPLVQRAAHAALYWVLEARYFTVFDRRLGKIVEQLTKRYIRKAVKDPKLRAAVTPDYAMGCKRILLSGDYPALNMSNVDVVTTGVAEVRPRSVLTGDGQEHPVDAIIYDTGFRVTDAFDHLSVVGRDGRKLQDAWHNGMEAYLGMTVSGFPNLFFLLGPTPGSATTPWCS